MAQGRNELPIDIVIANIRAAQKQIESLASKPYSINIDVKGKNFTAPLGKIKGQLGEFEKSLEASNARVIAFGASASAIYAVEKALSESVKAAIEVEKALVDINVILNLTDKSLSQFGTSLFNIAKDTGNTFSTVATAATELSRQGLGVAETLKRTQDALILTRLSGLGAAESVEAITAALNGFQTAALSSTDVVNKLAAVDASFAVSSGDLAEAIKRVGSTAEDAGVSFDQLIAIVTSAQQITARGGAVIGNSFKTIFTRLERPKVLDALQELGIQTQTLAGDTRPVIDILTELANKYDTLNDRQKSSIAEQVGGVFQINILKAALGDLSKEYSIYSNALQISTGASDEAIRRNEELNTTLAATLNKTLANLTAAGAKIVELSLAPALKKVMGGLNTALESFSGGDSEDVGNKIGEGLLRGLGNFLSGPGLIVGAKALFTIFERLTTFSADAVKTLLGLNTQAAQQAQIQEQITTLLSKNPQIIAQIASGEANVQSIQESILNTIKAQTIQMEQQTSLAKTLAASLSAAGVSIGRTGAGKGTLQARSGGFVPNLFGQEEQSAKSMGAVNPRAQISQGTIGGQKFVKNNKEIEIVGAGRNGDSAVIPTYGSIGDKRQKEFYDKLKFLGFVPNFAKTNQEEMQKNIYAAYRKINPAMLIAEGDQSVGSLKYKDATLQYPIIPLSKAGVESEKSIYQQFSSKEAIDQISRMVLDGATNYINSIGYKPPAKKITTDSLVGLFSKNSKYKGAYGALQAFIGAAFEVGTGEALGVSAAASDGGDFDVRNSSNIAKVRKYFPGNYNVADFKVSGSKTNRGSMSDKIKKDLDKLLPNLDIIRQGEKEAIKGKSLSSAKKTLQEYRQNLLVGDQRTVTKRNPSGTSPLDKLIAAKKAKGFIPNFAGIKTAMQAEKKMGGNPALDFQEGIGLYVRDKNTQSNFSAVKKDHPEGIGQAMKNSQKAQESLARGFIPNFAPAAGGVSAMTDLKSIFSDAQLSPALQKVKGNAFQASISLSILSGVIDTFNKDGESKLGSVVSEATQAAGTFASIASVIPGPAGLVVGGLVGTYQAFEGISKVMRDQTGPIKKALEEVRETSSKFNDSAQSYASTFEKLQESYKEPKGTPEEAAKKQIKLENDLSKSLADMPDAYRDQLASAKNLADVQELVAKFQLENLMKEKQLAVANTVAKKITDKGATSAFEGGQEKTIVKDTLNSVTPEQKNTFIEKYQKGEVKGLQTRKLADGTESIVGGVDDIVNAFRELGAGQEELAQIERLGTVPASQLQTALKNQVDEMIRNRDAANKLTQKIADQQKADAAAAKSAAELAAIRRADAVATEAAADAARQNAIFQMEFANTQKSNQSKIATEAAKSKLGTMQPFRGEATVARTSAAIEETRRTQDTQFKNESLQTTASKEMGDNLASVIQSQIDKLRNEGKDTTALSDAKGGITGLIQQGGTPEEVSARLKEFAEKSGIGEADLIALASKQAESIEKVNQGIMTNNEELNTQNQISADQLKAQLQQIKDQQLLKGGGGIQGFLNPETLKDPLEKFTQGLEGMEAGKKTGLGMMEARGGLQAGMALQELTGGLGDSKLNKSLSGLVVPQIAEQKRTMFNDIAAQAEAAGNNDLAKIARDAAAQADEMAQKQFDNQFKLEDSVAGIYDLLKNELNGTNSTENQTETGVQKGIEQASATMAAQETASAVGTTAPSTSTVAQGGAEPPLTDFQKMYVEEFQKANAKDPTIAETAPTMRSGAAGGYQFGFSPEETQAINSINTGAGPASANPITAGTLAADKTANTYKEKSYKQKSKDEFTSADWQAKEKDDSEAWNKEMAASKMASFGYQPQLGSGPSISDYWNSGKSSASEGEGIGKKKIGPIGTPLANTPTTTTGQVKEYTDQNNSKQQQLLQQRNALAGKNDPESKRQLKQLDQNLNTLRDQQKTAGTAGKEAGMRERPAQEIERQQKGRPLSSNQNDQGQTDQTKKSTEATEKNTKATSESKSEVNVAFTPISVEFKGSIETANDELSQKTMDAIQKAVEQIAPGIMAKLKGPPTEAKA